jgi:nucleoid-associated protein YgaU
MGNIGGIEKIMVFGILVIIVTILAIAFYSANRVENDLSSNPLLTQGQDEVQKIIHPNARTDEQKRTIPKSTEPIVKDLMGQDSKKENKQEPLKVNNHATPSSMLESRDEKRTANRLGSTPTSDRGRQQKNPVRVDLTPEQDSNTLPEVYEIKKGDSFMKIARALYGDESKYTDLIAANPSVDPRNLQIGQKIQLPKNGLIKEKNSKKPTDENQGQGNFYVVREGDTLAAIAKKFYDKSSAWRKIYNANREIIADPDFLKVGSRLTIP